MQNVFIGFKEETLLTIYNNISLSTIEQKLIQ